ncbi:MAG TPA: hypothetical protein VGC72_17630 [Candidatus Elarobacter sp.]|jgi:hypothetical protein
MPEKVDAMAISAAIGVSQSAADRAVERDDGRRSWRLTAMRRRGEKSFGGFVPKPRATSAV